MDKGVTLEEIFAPGGVLESRLENYEFRPSQLEMAQAVLLAIEQRHQLCVEAGTGTGKTLAYLIPALFSKKRVIVSTATRNLQDQLFSKDIPFIRKHLFPRLAVTYMKGRQNYLCLKRLHEQDPQLLPFAGAREDWGAISEWARTTGTGDRSELDWIADQDPLWQSLDARRETCLGQKCALFDDCFVTRMRRKALESDLVVVNHALFFANLALESDEIGKILPDFGVLVLDEAHEIEDIAADHFGKRLSNYQFDELERDCAKVFGDAAPVVGALARMKRAADRFFAQFPGGEGRWSLNFHRRRDGTWTDLRDELHPYYRKLRKRLELIDAEVRLLSEKPDDWEALSRRLGELAGALDEIFDMADDDSVYWYEKRRRGVFVHVTPIEVAPLMREKLFRRTDTAILTSATLTTGGNFDYLKERIGVDDPVELSVPGEFDYQSQAVLYVPGRLPAPGSPQRLLHTLRVVREILDICQGGAFLLFTSFQQLNAVYSALSRDLPYPLLRQGQMPKNKILETFKETSGSVLCATASFWQGVDVRGDALRAVVIDKLPFQVPTEPVVAARLHRLQSNGENAFMKYTLPDAIITLKQGLGRLIRSRQDRGILAVLDSRLRTRRYGADILASLPKCPVTDNMNSLRNFFQKAASSAVGGSQI